MLWAALVAGGVAIVSMAIFGARLTRKQDDDQHDQVVPAGDPNDPWAAWQPRPFEELDRPPRPRLWPVLTSLTGLVLVGGGLAGARQNVQEPTMAAESASEPYLIEVEVTPTPTPVVTPSPTPAPATPRPTARPQVAAPNPSAPAAPAAAGGPEISGSASCSELKARVNFVVTARPGTKITYVGVYLDGKVTGGGPVSSNRYEGGVQRQTTAGPHDFEVSAQDSGGKTSRRQWRTTCA